MELVVLPVFRVNFYDIFSGYCAGMLFHLYSELTFMMFLVASLLVWNVLLYLLLLYSFYFGVWAPAKHSAR